MDRLPYLENRAAMSSLNVFILFLVIAAVNG